MRGIEDIAAYLLGVFGIYAEASPFDRYRVYEDEKVTIIGRYDLEENAVYDELVINLKMASKPVPEVNRFGLPPRIDPSVPTVEVLYSQRNRRGVSWFNHYYRPGKWVMYLKQIHDEDLERRKNLNQFHEVPIDDADLFPEIE